MQGLHLDLFIYFLHVNVLFQCHLFENYPFFIELPVLLSQRSAGCICVGLFLGSLFLDTDLSAFSLIPYCLDSVISYTPKGDPQRKILWKIFSEHELTNSCFPFRPTFQTEIIVNKFRYLFFFKGFIYFGLFWVFSSFCVGFSLVAESGGYPQVA